MKKPYYETLTIQGIDFRFLIVPTILESGRLVYSWSLQNPDGLGTLEDDTTWYREDLQGDLQASAEFAARRLFATPWKEVKRTAEDDAEEKKMVEECSDEGGAS